MPLTDRQKLERVAPIVRDVATSFNYDPGHSDLDDEQPITFSCHTTLGALRKAQAASHYEGVAD
jgi:hypothetical protein